MTTQARFLKGINMFAKFLKVLRIARNVAVAVAAVLTTMVEAIQNNLERTPDIHPFDTPDYAA